MWSSNKIKRQRAGASHLALCGCGHRISREPAAAFLLGHFDPRIAMPKEWCRSAWPQGEPEWLKLSLSTSARQSAMQSWPDKLRVLLPDSNAAPSAARREVLWQRMALAHGYEDELPLEILLEEIEKLLCQTGLVDRPKLGQPVSKPVLFLTAALRAAADEAGLERRAFRILLMRMHQYLDVYAVLSDAIDEPQKRVRALLSPPICTHTHTHTRIHIHT